MTDLRAAPLTEAETRAGLWAIRRVLDLARHAVADRDDLDDVLGPAGFPDDFRGTLAELADRHDGFAPVLAEFDRLTGRSLRRRAFDVDDDPWRDCGEGD